MACYLTWIIRGKQAERAALAARTHFRSCPREATALTVGAALAVAAAAQGQVQVTILRESWFIIITTAERQRLDHRIDTKPEVVVKCMDLPRDGNS